VDALWEQTPASAVNTVHKHVCTLRAVLEPGRPGRGGQLLTGDYSYAEDLVQASLVKLYRAWPRLDTSTDLDAYLRRIIVNTRLSR
jgi:Sigma-70 region 2